MENTQCGKCKSLFFCPLENYSRAEKHYCSKKCFREKSVTHGQSKTGMYRILMGIKTRVTNKKDKHYKWYGGRGITMPDYWSDFEMFLRDVGERPSKKHSLDRINNDEGYSKENCRWVLQKVQQNNRTNFNVPVSLNGVTKNVSEWAEELGIKHQTLFARLYRGWSAEKALVCYDYSVRNPSNKKV